MGEAEPESRKVSELKTKGLRVWSGSQGTALKEESTFWLGVGVFR